PTDREALCAWTDLCLEHERWARAAELSLALSESAGARGLGLSRAARAYSALRRYPQALAAARAACDHDPALLHTETAADLAVALASGRRLMDAERLLAPLLQSQDPRLRAVAELAQETARKLNAPAIDSRDLREPWTPGQGAPPPK
ncbi:MAG: hypothetical protein KDD82_09525, partial [Planctomycetes bacterium]|nr:hypothetical protein [Planctomycetota bacterium]